jgi:hypothetical protein
MQTRKMTTMTVILGLRTSGLGRAVSDTPFYGRQVPFHI